mmetsp:Transcript_15624/g.47127  ORF Transcript_15624/g.47127 Transcript_15624/m.47127 type:complete len:308 (-) Transcript_15624:580-1503(-)
MSASAHRDVLAGFVVSEVLNRDPLSKSLTLLGTFSGDRQGPAIVLLTRRPFAAEDAQRTVSGVTCREKQFENDIYSKYTAALQLEHSLINVDLTCPATERHISKARAQRFVMVRETPTDYAEVTLPYIRSIPTARLGWVRNILNKSAEAERLLVEDADPTVGFVLHPDLKWDQTDVETLYCLAICHSTQIQSLRDLTAEHLPLLRNIRDKGCKALQDKYGVSKESLRIFVHYQPSYYHFHVHFQHACMPGAPGTTVGKAHLLDDVIDNIATFGSNFYLRCTLTFAIGTSDPLWEHFRGRTPLRDSGV